MGRFVRYLAAGDVPRVGVLADPDTVIDIDAAIPDPRRRAQISRSTDVIQLLQAGCDLAALVEGAHAAHQRDPNVGRPRSTLRLLAPLAPGIVLCAGENYVDHLDEKPPIERREPEFFLKMPQVVVGPDDPIVYPRQVTTKLDYEVELAVVIGGTGRNVSPEDAPGLVLGYTIMNDVTARDRQVRLRPDGTAQYALGGSKNFDSSAPLGPAVVTSDEIDDPQALGIRSLVNGGVRQASSTRHMITGVNELVAFFSRYVTLRPGFVISTGTPGGTAWGSDPQLGGTRSPPVRGASYLQEGDVVTCEIEGLGVLENPVVAPA